MDFTKIKDDGKEVTLRWITRTGTGEKQVEIRHELVCRERPHPSFREAMRAFVLPTLALLALPEDYAHEFAVVGLSVNAEEDGRRGLVLTCFKKLEDTNAPLVLNTPHLREYVDGDPEGCYIPSSMLRALEAAAAAAARYVTGEREQLGLDLAPPADSSIESVTLTGPNGGSVTFIVEKE